MDSFTLAPRGGEAEGHSGGPGGPERWPENKANNKCLDISDRCAFAECGRCGFPELGAPARVWEDPRPGKLHESGMFRRRLVMGTGRVSDACLAFLLALV